jgi:hypothetical protein
MDMLYIVLKIAFFVFILKISMNWIYNIVFFVMKKPYLFLACSFLFNIIAFQILNLLIPSLFNESILDIYGFACLISIILLLPPKNTMYTEREFNEICDEFSGIKHSRLFYRISLFLFFTGGIVGGYII